MDYQNSLSLHKEELSQQDFNRLSSFIMSEYGIKMPPEKKIMLQSRLQRRLKALNLNNFKEYVEYLFSPSGQSEEVIHMMDVVSTNKTDFFRESNHFDYMLSDILPELVLQRNNQFLQIWSAGCSSGEEPYTIAITLSEFKERHRQFDYSIDASDISTKMLEKAAVAIYPEERIAQIPHTIKVKYFLRSKNREEKKIRVISAIRDKVHFFRQNLLYLPLVNNPVYDIIFCRNVLIYFSRENQFSILQKLCMQLKQGGFLILGHSESISGMELPIEHIKPTIFKKNNT